MDSFGLEGWAHGVKDGVFMGRHAERGRPGRVVVSRRAVLLPFLGLLVVSFGTYALMKWLEPKLPDRGVLELLPDYVTWLRDAAVGDLWARLLWIVGDASEGAFLKSVPASLGLISFALFSAKLDACRAAAFGQPAPSARELPKTLGWTLIAMVVEMLIFGWTLEGGWTPTFVVFLLSQILIGHFGTIFERAATVTLLVALVPCPVCLLLLRLYATPLGLPAFAGVGLGMAISTVVICEVCRLLPWMAIDIRHHLPARRQELTRRQSVGESRKAYVARVFQDFADLPAIGGTLAGVGMLLGLVLGWELNCDHGVYGTGLTAELLCTLMATAALSVFIHYHAFRHEGDACTFPALLVIGSIVVTYQVTPLILVPAVLASAFCVPWLTRQAIRLTPVPRRWPNSVYAQVVAALSCAVLSFFAIVVQVIIG